VRRPGRPLLAAALAASVACLAPGRARGDGLGVKEEAAVRAMFPGSDRIDVKDVLLTDEMVARIEKLARARVPERLVTFYTAHRGGDVLGYAAIHTHVVRTKQETLSLAFEPDGRIRKITVLSFLEPPEYKAPDRWLAQFDGKRAGDRLAVGQDIAPITGATLTARGITEASRWLLQALRETTGVPR
jgi:FMN-binding domain